MKNYFFSISTIIVLLLSSCSSDNFETQQELTNVSLKRKQNHISYSDAKKLAEDYTKSIYTLFDKLEENKFKNENEAFEFSISYMHDSNNLILQKFGYEGISDYNDFLPNNQININNISKLEISDIEKHYLTNLYKYHLEQDDTALVNLTDNFIRDIEKYNELESLSFYFALIDVNRDLFSSNSLFKSKSNCAKAAIISGTVSGVSGMIGGAVKGGIYGTVLGMNPGTGAVGAIAGAIGGGLSGFVSGAVTGYLTCKVYG